MPSTFLFVVGTLFLSLNFVRFFGLAISDWFYFGAMILALIETFRFERENFHSWTSNKFLSTAGLILFGAIISTSHALFLKEAIIEIFQQMYVVTLFISLIWIMVRRGNTNVIVQAFIWAGVFAASIAVIDYFAGTTFGPKLSGTPNVQFWGRYAGTLGHPNKLGYFLVLSSLLSLARLVDPSFISSRFISKLVWGLLLSVQIFGLYLSGSLTAYLGLLLGGIVLLASSKVMAKRVYSLVVPVLFFGIPLLLFSLSFGIYSPPNNSYSRTSLISTAITRVETNTANSRWHIFGEALQSISKNPLVGVGYDQISTSGIDVDLRGLDGTIHNLLLQNWYVGGILTFIGWLVIYIRLGWMAFTTARLGQRKGLAPILLGIAAAALSIILMDQFQDAIYQREKWLVFGLLASWVWTTR